ncbi:CoA pyrophosphatase [Gallaecimonas sp. GXIMD4217]|uniref:CoA pyrophosphatase n=1 Tax=Gallaecimonas sp. GXIMD4217 TaxID=3131927 RepID=UPI00311AE7F1
MSRSRFARDFLLRPLEERHLGVPELQSPKPAAVLLAIMDKPEPNLLLTRRTLTLRHHGGQVALPGGRVDDSDPSHEHAALREAWEEVGLLPEQVQVLGRLNPYDTVSRFRITPVVGLAPEDFPWLLSVDEVDAVFEMPLKKVLDLNRYRTLDIQRHGQHHRLFCLPYREHLIWGATAAILYDLALHLR